jgi:hypothetical protein
MAIKQLVDLADYFPQTNVKSNDPIKQASQSSPSDDAFAILNRELPKVQQNVIDPYMRGKERVWGADMNNMKYERYYNHPQFNRLGFNPFIDNEAKYNANSSWTDDLARASTQWGTLAQIGFGLGPSSDREEAKLYKRAADIGTSTRGGLGGFATNLYLNSGYTFGLMGEIILEEIGLAVATAATGGGAGAAALARTGVNASRLARGFQKTGQFFKSTNKIVNALDDMADVNVFRKIYQAAKTGEIGIGKFAANSARFAGKQIAGETYNFLSNFNKLDNLTGMAKTTLGLGSAYRDVRNVRLAFAESGLEGGMVENQMLDDLYSDFVSKNGRAPNEEEAAKIRGVAKQAGGDTISQNMPVIYFSNNIAFGSLFKAINPMRKIVPELGNNFAKLILDKKKGFEVVEKGFKTSIKALAKPKTYGKMALSYMSANLAEGLQEIAQEVISGTNTDYYKNLYSNGARGGYYDSLAKNISSQFSSQGFETFTSGFLMGGLVSPVSSVLSGVGGKFNALTDKNYQTTKEQAIADLNKKANILNDLYKDPLKMHNLNLNNLVEQKEMSQTMSEAEQEGDTKKFYDTKYRSMANHFYTVLENGMEDTFKQRFKELASLTDDELMEALPTAGNVEQARKNLQEMSTKVDEFKKSYKFVKENFKNPFDPSKYKADTPEYQQEAFAYISFQEAQKDVIFMREGFRTSLVRMNSILNEAVKDVGVSTINTSDITNLFSIQGVQTEINNLKEELAVYGEQELVTPQAKKLFTQKKEKLDALQQFDTALTDLLSNINTDTETLNKDLEGGTKKVVDVKQREVDQKVYNKALDAYKNYIKTLAGRAPVTDKNLEAAFDKLVDYYNLDSEGVNMNNAVNTLMNPEAFFEYAARKQQVIASEHANRKIRITEALNEYRKGMEGNKLLQKLYEKDMFFDIADYEALVNEGKMPRRIYNISNNDEIKTTSLQYEEAISIFRDFAIEVLDIPLDYNRALDQYNTEAREKFPFDERTYTDLAEQYGFDPTASTSKVPLKQVLEAIVDSEFATDQEKALARRLVKFAKPNETVTFVKNLAGPGKYTTEDQSVIDARYSASEFKSNAQSYPLEVSILREEVNRRLYNGLKEDPEFKTNMQNLFNSAVQYYKDNEQFYDKPFIGLVSLEDFMRETMTSDAFRTFLSEVEFEGKTTTGWVDFVNKSTDYIQSVFSNESTNTALNGAIAAITTRIDKAYKQAQEVKGETVEEEVVRPENMTVEELNETSPELMAELVEAFKEYKINTTGLAVQTPAETVEDEIELIKNSTDFEAFLKLKTPRVLALYEKYFPQAGPRVIQRRPGIKQTQTQTDQTFLLTEQINKLKDLGYTQAEIEQMDVLEGINIVLQGETKEETLARVRAEQEDLDQQREDARKEIVDRLNAIENFNDFEIFDAELIADVTLRNTSGFKPSEINEMLLNKKKELAYKTNFDDINVDDYLVINNLEKGIQSVWRIAKKTKNQLTLVSLKDATSTFTINRSDFAKDNTKRLIFKYDINMAPEDMKMNEVTPEGQATSNENVQVFENLSEEEIDAAFKASKNINPDDALNNFLDNLNNACK